MENQKRFLKSVLILMIILFVGSQTGLQALNLKVIPQDKNYFRFSFTHPFFKDDDTVTPISGVYDFSYSRYIGRGFYLDFNIPLVHLNNDYSPSESTFGYFYLGLQKVFKKNSHHFSISLGALIDTKDQTSATLLTQFFTTPYATLNFYGRGHTFTGNFGWEWHLHSGWFIKAELGPHVVVFTEEPFPASAEWLWCAHFGISAGFITKGLMLAAEYVQNILLTGEYQDSSDYIFPQWAFEIQYRRGLFKPGIFFTLNMNKYLKELVNYSIGLKIELDI